MNDDLCANSAIIRIARRSVSRRWIPTRILLITGLIFRLKWLVSGGAAPKMSFQETGVITPSTEAITRTSEMRIAERNSGTERIRLVLLDTHALFRASLARFLESESDLEVTATCGSCGEALMLIRNNAVDVVVLEIAIGRESGITFLSAARQQGFGGRFLILTSAISAMETARALKLGASGVFLKSDKPERLIEVVRLVANGEIWIDPTIVQLLAERVIDPHYDCGDQLMGTSLADRERKVLFGIISGLSNRRIGEGMSLSESSVKAVVQRLFARLGVRTRTQLVRMALDGSLGASFATQARCQPEAAPDAENIEPIRG